MFRALLVGLGSMCLIALVVIGLRQIDVPRTTAGIGALFRGEERSPLLRQAEADAQYVRQDALAGLATRLQAVEAEVSVLGALNAHQAQTDRTIDALRAQLRQLEALALDRPAPRAVATPSNDPGVAARIDALESRISTLDAALRQRDDTIVAIQRELQRLTREVAAIVPGDPMLRRDQQGLAVQITDVQSALRQMQGRLDALTTPTLAAPAASVSAVSGTQPPSILARTPGWLVALHPAEGRPPNVEESPLRARIPFDAYDFTMGDHRGEFPGDTNMAYRGAGHLAIERAGPHVFVMEVADDGIGGHKYTAYCVLELQVDGQTVFDVSALKIQTGEQFTFTGEAMLPRGEVDLQAHHYCHHGITKGVAQIAFDLKVLAPGASRPQPLGGDMLYYKQ